MKKLFNLRPVLFIALNLCCGIAATYFFMRDKTVWGVFFCVSFFLSIILFFFVFTEKKFRKRNGIFALIFIFFFFSGGLTLYAQLSDYRDANLYNHYYELSGKVSSVSDTDSGKKLIIEDVFIDGNVTGKIKYNVAVFVYGHTAVDVGDVIKFSSTLADKSFIYEDLFNAQDVERKIKYTANVNADDIKVIGSDLTIFERINLFLRDTLKSGLDKDEFAVGYAMLTGNSNYIDDDVLSSYRTAGVAHIFAVSGLHIGFLAAVLVFALKKAPINAYLKAVIITAVLLLYSGICGFSASSLRATVMTAVALVAKASGDRYDGLSSTALSALLILIVSPVQLLCVGFQLSFVVVLGINLLSKPIEKLLGFLPQKVASALGVVLSAQIFSIPVSLVAFGEFSVIAVLANLIFVPVISVIFTATVILTLLGGIFSLAPIFLFPINYIFKFVNLCISVFDQPFFMLGGFILGGGIIAYYATAISACGLVNLKKTAKLITSVSTAVICLTCALIFSISDQNAVKLYVSGAEDVSATFIQSKTENVMIVSDVKHIYSTRRLARVATKSGKRNISALVFMGGYNVDMQVFMTKITNVYDVDAIYYYGEQDLGAESIIKRSFGKVEMKNFGDGERLPIKVFKCSFALEGKVIIGDIKGDKVAVFSSLPYENINFSSVQRQYDIMICHDRADALISRFKPTKGISYRYSNNYPNAESSGNMLVKIS